MARFEQQISEHDVTAARKKIASGASLRSAAAGIPCAPSTLSVRIRKAEAAEAYVDGGMIGANEQHAAQSASGQPGSPTVNAGQGALSGEVGPVEILRGAMFATRANGQPDWPTRVSAVRTLVTLRPEEIEPKKEEEPREPEIIVYDLPPGASPVLHRPPLGTEATVGNADAPSAGHPTSSTHHMFNYRPADSESVLIGMWSTPGVGDSAGATILAYETGEGEEAERWRAELSAGRLPVSSEDEP